MLRLIVLGLVPIASAVSAEDFNWRSPSNQAQMSAAFENAARACAATFGFTPIALADRAKMPDRIDAYLLLRDDPEAVVQGWAALLRPIRAMAAEKSTASTEEDDREAASAAVAAAEDPAVYDEAQERYMEHAMGPFRRAMDACSAGAGDPFLGKYYWTGTGSPPTRRRT